MQTSSLARAALALALVALTAAACQTSTTGPVGQPTCVPLTPMPITSAGPAAASGGLESPSAAADLASPNGVIVFAVGTLAQGTATLQSVWPDDTHLARLTSQTISSFAVSPDGSSIEFNGPGGPSLVRLDGTGEHPLLLGADLKAGSFHWAPNGRWLVFRGVSGSNPGLDGIYEVDPNGCQPVRVAINGSAGDTPVAVSPDGSSILAIGDVQASGRQLAVGTIYIERPSDGSRTALTPAGGVSLVDAATGPPASWSPDGKRVAFTASPGTTAANWGTDHNGLFVADSDGTHVTTIYDSGIAAGVEWSPDGSGLVTTKLDDQGVPQVLILKPDGSGARFVTAFPSPGGCCGVWSPDSSTILTWGGTTINFADPSKVGIVREAGQAATYAYSWVKPATP